MVEGLANLPSRGILSPGEGISWKKTRASITHHVSLANPDQTLCTDNSTEALVRILKSQQQQKLNTTTGGKPAGKRPLGSAEPASGLPKKRPAAESAAPAADAPSGAGPSTAGAAAGAGQARSKVIFSQEELRGKTVKELQDLLKARGLPVSGKKDALTQRMIDYQRRAKMASSGV